MFLLYVLEHLLLLLLELVIHIVLLIHVALREHVLLLKYISLGIHVCLLVHILLWVHVSLMERKLVNRLAEQSLLLKVLVLLLLAEPVA